MATKPPAQEAERSTTSLPMARGTEMLATFLSLMPDAAVAVDGDGQIVAVNERTEAFFGYTASELEGKDIELLVPERFRHVHRAHRSAFSKAPHARPMAAGLDLYARRRDGSEFPVDISLAPIGDEDPIIVAAIRDISERKAAQSAQAQLATIVESSGDGIFSITESGVVTSWNPGAESIFGFSRSKVIGHHISDFFPEDRAFEELLSVARRGGRTGSRDTCWPKADGALIDVAITVSSFAIGAQKGFSVMARDITARKAAEAELQRQAKWQQATAEIRLTMLSESTLESSLGLVCTWAVDLLGARSAEVLVGQGPERQASAGEPVAHLPGGGQVHRASISRPGARREVGVLLVVMGAERPWGEHDDQILQSLADSALLALELAAVRDERDRLLISADRERIARDLHDLVIQRLFGAGLRLQGALGLINNEAASARVTATVNDLDATIKEIREAIFALESSPGAGLRSKLTEAVAAAVAGLGFEPSVRILDDKAPEVPLQVQVEAAAVLREALSNAARHARASTVDVLVNVTGDLAITVEDNGVGIGQPTRSSGIANARARARLLGGDLEVNPRTDGGTRFHWHVPLTGN